LKTGEKGSVKRLVEYQKTVGSSGCTDSGGV
jgi:hypothetical protein